MEEMERLKRIKREADCVVTQVYESGKLVAIRYHSPTWGEAEERLFAPAQMDQPMAESMPPKRRHREE